MIQERGKASAMGPKEGHSQGKKAGIHGSQKTEYTALHGDVCVFLDKRGDGGLHHGQSNPIEKHHDKIGNKISRQSHPNSKGSKAEKPP